MRISKLIARVEDGVLCVAQRAKSTAANFRSELRERQAQRMARQIESQAAIAARAFEIVANRDARVIKG